MNTSIAAQSFNAAEPIPGYRMIERIGAGGYGEVWKAEAPGGIAKAIKVVYGYQDDERASRELSALNRIKEVRHPFVLSLERIELVAGHLVIVTELATASMKMLFTDHRSSGLAGIPRSELLGYLRDAADALDYLYHEHSLQHLDVKPENLLLVGGRVKVADFGLVKDLQDVNCSMINGLTPVYAAPELFDGRPNCHSDQYSLAIVYQEMLTGVPPFLGRTTAQLAAQHLHSRPRLDCLPASDQAVISRALSKDPEQRFPSCREMVESLLEVTPNRPSHQSVMAAGANAYYAPQMAPVKTEIVSREGIRAGAAAATLSTLSQALGAAPAVQDLPPLEIKPQDAHYGPTIFLGIGGLAAKTLQSLRRRLVDRFGDLRALPALQLLLLETDAETLKTATEGEDQTSLSNESAILLPLRQPANYRLDSSNYLQWLNRRWIYNIPRSLQTQGLRPLGRLALVDNFARAAEQISRVIKAAVDPQGLAASAEATGLPFAAAAPRVFIISSISGGTGSGMVLDVAYLVRKTLRDLGCSEEGLCGVLAHCTSRNPQGRELAVANAYAFLSELHHYSDFHQFYPGEPACGLPGFAAQDAPFTHTYVAHLGEELEPKEFLGAVDTLANYLYSNAVTSAAAFFDKCRAPQQQGGDSASADPMVRTFGLCQLGLSYDDVPAAAVDSLCKALVTRWRRVVRAESENHPASLADPSSMLVTQLAEGLSAEELRAEVASRTAAMGLDVARIVEPLNDAIATAMGDSPEAYLLNVLEQLLNNHKAGGIFSHRLPPGEVIVDTLDGLIRSPNGQDSQHVCLESALEQFLKEAAARHADALREWILGLVASPKYRVEKAQHAADYVVERLRELSREAGELVQTRRHELCPLRETLLSDKNDGRDWLRFRGFFGGHRLVVDRRLSQYFHLGIEELALNGVRRLAGLILAQVTTLSDKLRNLAADLDRLAEEFHAQPQPHGGEQNPAAKEVETLPPMVAEMVNSRKAEMVSRMECDLEDLLRRFVTREENDIRRVLARVLRLAARSTILRTIETVVLRGMQACGGEGGPGAIFSPVAGVKSAKPRLSQCGGARRLLLAAPNEFPLERLLREVGGEVGETPTVVADAENRVLFCYEAEQLSLRRVAAALLDRRFQNVEIAARLHTRIDVNWSPL
jgi:hypothetical protein